LVTRLALAAGAEDRTAAIPALPHAEFLAPADVLEEFEVDHFE